MQNMDTIDAHINETSDAHELLGNERIAMKTNGRTSSYAKFIIQMKAITFSAFALHISFHMFVKPELSKPNKLSVYLYVELICLSFSFYCFQFNSLHRQYRFIFVWGLCGSPYQQCSISYASPPPQKLIFKDGAIDDMLRIMNE